MKLAIGSDINCGDLWTLHFGRGQGAAGGVRLHKKGCNGIKRWNKEKQAASEAADLEGLAAVAAALRQRIWESWKSDLPIFDFFKPFKLLNIAD